MYLFYIYALYKTTYFVWSRWYFILAIAISLLIPIIPFPYSLPNNSFISDLILMKTSDGVGITIFRNQNSFWDVFKPLVSNPYFNVINLLLVVYISGVIRYSIIFVRNIVRIISLIRTSKIEDKADCKMVITKNNLSTFSWFTYIFLGSNTRTLSPTEYTRLIEHEKIHIKRLHSIDLLIFELFGILFWFNPLVKKAKQTLKNIHEFIVDNLMLKTVSGKEYSDLLIKLSSQSENISFVNHFSRNPLLDRIWIIVFPSPERLRKLRFLSGIPLMIISILVYSFIISEINYATNSLQLNAEHEFVRPVQGKFQIVSPFFTKKTVGNNIKGKSEYQVLVSHPEISIATKSFAKVVATRKGIVEEISIKDNWGINEISIKLAHNKGIMSIYKGLKTCIVNKNDTIMQSQVIGLTGDNRLYPTISFQLLKNNKPVDPMKYIK